MMIFTWKITHNDRKKFIIDGQEYNNIVTHVHWRCEATDETDVEYEDRIGGTVPFDILEIRYVNKRGEEVIYPSQFDPNNHIPFEDITDDLLIQWVKNFLGQEEITRIESVLRDRFNSR